MSDILNHMHECKRGLSTATPNDYNKWWRYTTELEGLLTRVLVAEGAYLPTSLLQDIRAALEKEAGENITTKEGLLWRDGKIIDLPEADRVARKNGFLYAEQFIKYLEKKDD
jgi:hypothetical protein